MSESPLAWMQPHVDRYSVEPHGDGYAIYYGRSATRHGYNFARLSDLAANAGNIPKLIEDGLNSTVRITTLTTQLETERERATKAEERCEAYKGQVEAGAKEIERLREALQEIRDMRTELPGRDGYERGFNDARFRCKNIADEALKAGSSADE